MRELVENIRVMVLRFLEGYDRLRLGARVVIGILLSSTTLYFIPKSPTIPSEIALLSFMQALLLSVLFAPGVGVFLRMILGPPTNASSPRQIKREISRNILFVFVLSVTFVLLWKNTTSNLTVLAGLTIGIFTVIVSEIALTSSVSKSANVYKCLLLIECVFAIAATLYFIPETKALILEKALETSFAQDEKRVPL